MKRRFTRPSASAADRAGDEQLTNETGGSAEPREMWGRCDIGAYESYDDAVTIFADRFSSGNTNAWSESTGK